MRPLKPEYTAGLRRRRVLRYLAFGLLFAILLGIALDHFGAFGFRGDDFRPFDGRSFVVARVSDRGTLFVGNEEVRLLGVDVPAAGQYWAQEAKEYLSEHVVGMTVILQLGALETRDAQKCLLAYVYVSDVECLNVNLVREGCAYADRRKEHALHTPIETAETEARKRGRGLWKEIKFWQMPKWRQAWLKDKRRSTTREVGTGVQ